METSPSVLVLTAFGVAAAVLAAVCALWMMRIAAKAAAPDLDNEIGIYRDQIAEIERDLAEGRLEQATADAALVETGRRLLRAEQRATEQQPNPTLIGKGPIAAIVGLVVLGAGGLYVWHGQPILDQPFAARERALLEAPASQIGPDELVVILQERIRDNPNDPDPHVALGQVLVSTDRDSEALRAFQAALRREPNNVDAISEIGALMVRAADGQITPEAQEAFDAALSIDPDHVPTRYYLALAAWRSGEQDRAIGQWRGIWASLDGDDRARIELASQVFQAVSALDRGPGTDNTGPMEGLAPADQKAVVEGMVQRRLEALAQSPRDFGLRASALRVQAVTGDIEAARRTLEEGLSITGDDQFLQAVLVTGAAMTGVGVPQADD